MILNCCQLCLSWLEGVLAESEREGRSVIIFGHIPPGKFERFYQFCGEYKGCDTHGGYQGFHWMRSDFSNSNVKSFDLFITASSLIRGKI